MSNEELSAEQIEQGWHATFSTSNPYCPVDLKSFTKAVRWAERAIHPQAAGDAAQGAERFAPAGAVNLACYLVDHCEGETITEESLQRWIGAMVKLPRYNPTDESELASMTRMFHAACADLGAINEALDLDPNDGGAEPILEAITELKTQIAAPVPPAAAAPEEPNTRSYMKEGRWCPDECPITGLKFFMWLGHPELGYVPTYGGPFDSYTLTMPDEDGYLRAERYDHDEGSWVEGGHPMTARNELIVAAEVDDEYHPTPESERAAFNGMMRWHLIRLLQAWRYGGDLRAAGIAAFEWARTNDVGQEAFKASERKVKLAAQPPVAADAAAPSVDARLGAFVRTLATQLADSPKSFLANVLRAITDLDSETQTEQPDERAAFDDREIADIVNRLRDTLEMWGGTQQIRERIADVIVPILTRAAEIASDRNSWRALAESAKRDLASRATAPQATKGDAPWIERWHGSEPFRGWSIFSGRERIAFIGGDETLSEAVSEIVQAHNCAAVQQAEKAAYERGWDDGHIAGREKARAAVPQASRAVALEAALTAVIAERLEDPTKNLDDVAYDMDVDDCADAIRALAKQGE